MTSCYSLHPEFLFIHVKFRSRNHPSFWLTAGGNIVSFYGSKNLFCYMSTICSLSALHVLLFGYPLHERSVETLQ